MLLKLGSAFDVVGERRQLDFNVDTTRKTMTEEIEVKLRNQKKRASGGAGEGEPVSLGQLEHQLERSHEYRKDDARTVVFPVGIAADAEAVRALHRAVQLVAIRYLPPTGTLPMTPST